MTATPRFIYEWHWRTCQNPNAPQGVRMVHVYAHRVGERLRVIARSTAMNSALVEFADGHRSIVSRNALRRAATVQELGERRAAGIARHGVEGYWDEDFTRDHHHHEEDL